MADFAVSPCPGLSLNLWILAGKSASGHLWSFGSAVRRRGSPGMKAFAVIDRGDETRGVGPGLRDATLLIVGSPLVSTAAIAAAPLAALELPLRLLVWEDGYQTKVSYPSPAQVARRYGFGGDLAAALESIHGVTSAVVVR
jgi:uncharacterized protein (DUF302 family)